jgi:hypothetical protein
MPQTGGRVQWEPDLPPGLPSCGTIDVEESGCSFQEAHVLLTDNTLLL